MNSRKVVLFIWLAFFGFVVFAGLRYVFLVDIDLVNIGGEPAWSYRLMIVVSAIIQFIVGLVFAAFAIFLEPRRYFAAGFVFLTSAGVLASVVWLWFAVSQS